MMPNYVFSHLVVIHVLSKIQSKEKAYPMKITITKFFFSDT